MATEQRVESPGVRAAGSPGEARESTPLESSGVESLIRRLRDDGVAEGLSQAESLVAAARQQAADIVAAANNEADAVLARAGEETTKLKTAGEDALRLAMRDTILSMESDLIREFANRLQRLVKGTLADPVFLQRLILEVASKAAPPSDIKRAELLLPADLISLEDLRQKPEEAQPGTLMHFVLSMGGEMLRESMSFGVAEDATAGVRLRLVDEDVQIDLTETAVTGLLLRHMLPRFRALLRGSVTTGSTGAETTRKEPAEK
jgi:V/A-type H+/Na+-transporting ATPase subunit E